MPAPDRVLNNIRLMLAARFGQHRDEPLLGVGIERDPARMGRIMQFRFRDASLTYTGLDHDDPLGFPLSIITPTVLIQLFRLEYHHVFGRWESYIPEGGRRYTLQTRWAYMLAQPDAMVPMEVTITSDPFYARDPGGEELTVAMQRAEALLEHAQRNRGTAINFANPFAQEAFQPERQYQVAPRPGRHRLDGQELAEVYRELPQDLAQVYRDAYNAAAAACGMDEPSPMGSEAKGWRLLRDHLTPEQLTCLDNKGYFEVIGGETGIRYQIRTGRSFNIDVVGRSGQIGDTLCFQPTGCLCTGDVMLTQKLALELRESDALKVANHGSPTARAWLLREFAVRPDDQDARNAALQERRARVQQAMEQDAAERRRAPRFNVNLIRLFTH